MVSRHDCLIARIVPVEPSFLHPTCQLGEIIPPFRNEYDQFRAVSIGEIGWFHGANMRPVSDTRKERIVRNGSMNVERGRMKEAEKVFEVCDID